jgi:hypothetical protein
MRKPRAKPRIWKGDYGLPGDRTPAQREFFRSIERVAPEVLKSLHDEILPRFQEMVGDKKNFQRMVALNDRDIEPDWLWLSLGPRIAPPPELYQLIWDWAARFRLVQGKRLLPALCTLADVTSEDEAMARLAEYEVSSEKLFFYSWAFFAIIKTLADWAYDPEKPTLLTWTLPNRPYPVGPEWGWSFRGVHNMTFDDLFTPVRESDLTLDFRCPAWIPTRETRAAAKRRIMLQLEKDVDLAFDQQENLMQLIGCPVASGTSTKEHFDWLVMYQVQERNYHEIGRLYVEQRNEDFRDKKVIKSASQTVTDGIRNAARQILGDDIWRHWLRPAPRGRARNP